HRVPLPLLPLRSPTTPRGLPPCPTRRSSDLGSREVAGYRRLGLRGLQGRFEDRACRWCGGRDGLLCLSYGAQGRGLRLQRVPGLDRKSTRLNSSHVKISYAVFCLKKKKKRQQ